MEINLNEWRHNLKNQHKHLVHWWTKPGEGIFTQCFRRILDPHRKCIPVMFKTNPNLYKRRKLTLNDTHSIPDNASPDALGSILQAK